MFPYSYRATGGHKKDLFSLLFLTGTKEVLQCSLRQLHCEAQRADFPLPLWGRAKDRQHTLDDRSLSLRYKCIRVRDRRKACRRVRGLHCDAFTEPSTTFGAKSSARTWPSCKHCTATAPDILSGYYEGDACTCCTAAGTAVIAVALAASASRIPGRGRRGFQDTSAGGNALQPNGPMTRKRRSQKETLHSSLQ